MQAVQGADKIDFESLKYMCNSKARRYNNGLYFVYDKFDKIIYIGKIGNGDYANLRSRFFCGSSAHINDGWASDAEYLRFKTFPYYGEAQLELAERIAIISAGVPIYNDKYTDDETMDEFNWRF